MKFKVGDKVKIRKDIEVGTELTDLEFLIGMKEDADDDLIFEIEEIKEDDNTYLMKEINDINPTWWMSEEWIELVNEKNKILFAKVKLNAIIPTKRKEDGAFDIYACFEEDNIVIQPHETKMIATGLASAFSLKYVAILKERGSTGTKGMGQRAGVVDSGYRGEWFVPITNHNEKPLIITKETNQGTLDILSNNYIVYPYTKAIAQVVMVEVPQLEIEEVTPEEILSITSERGTGCLGSSNK